MEQKQQIPTLQDLAGLVNNVVQFMILLRFNEESIRGVVDAYNTAISNWNRVNVKEAKIISIHPYINYRKEVSDEEQAQE